MKHQAKSIRAFIGAKDFGASRSFYRDIGFEETVISGHLSYFQVFEALGFYLQDAYVADWVNNSMVFLEVDDIDRYWDELQEMKLDDRYEGVRLVPIREEGWGREFFLHDPSGVLWHFGVFKR